MGRVVSGEGEKEATIFIVRGGGADVGRWRLRCKMGDGKTRLVHRGTDQEALPFIIEERV